MTAEEAFEKYEHLDANLSDRELVPESFWGSIIVDLWGAIKNSIQKGEKTMESIHVEEIKKVLTGVKSTVEVLLHAISNKILIGEINRPNVPAEKKPRKKRTPKVKVVDPGVAFADILDSSLPDPKKIRRKRRTKKEMESERFQDIPRITGPLGKFPETVSSLSEDKSSFYNKPKKERKERGEVKTTVPVEE